MKMTELLVYGKHRDTRKMVFIVDAIKGKKCNCICAGCGETLIARQGQHNTAHFAHANGDQCRYAVESALHLLSKEIIAESNFIRLPDNSIFNFREVAIETKVLDLRPDAILRNETEVLHIEFFVTHSVGYNKRNYLIEQNLKTIEIDLSDLPRNITKTVLQQIIIEENSRKQFISKKDDLSLFNPVMYEVVFTEAVITEICFKDAVIEDAVIEDAVVEEAIIEEAIIEEAHVETVTPWYLKLIGIALLLIAANWLFENFIQRSKY